MQPMGTILRSVQAPRVETTQSLPLGRLGPLEQSHAGVSEPLLFGLMVIASGMLCIRQGEEKKDLSAHVPDWNWLCRVCLVMYHEEDPLTLRAVIGRVIELLNGEWNRRSRVRRGKSFDCEHRLQFDRQGHEITARKSVLIPSFIERATTLPGSWTETFGPRWQTGKQFSIRR